MSGDRLTWQQEIEAKAQQIEHVRWDLTQAEGMLLCAQRVLFAARETARDEGKKTVLGDLGIRLDRAIEVVQETYAEFCAAFKIPPVTKKP